MGNKNSSSKSKVNGQAARATSTETQHVPMYGKSSTKTNMMLGSSTEQSHGTKGNSTITWSDEIIGNSNASEQQYRKGPLDTDDTFTDFIRRAKNKLRTFTMSKSNVDSKHDNAAAPTPAPAPEKDNGTTNSNTKDNQRDQFSEFIQRAKKKLRTTSSIGNNRSLKRG